MAEINLQTFRDTIKDVARPNRFLLSIDTNNPDENFQFIIRSTAHPGRTLGEIQLRWQGLTNKIPGDLIFEDWEVVVLNDINHAARQFFADWKQEYVNYDTNDRAALHTAKRNAIVTQLGNDGEPLPDGAGKYQLTGIYPKSVGEIEFNHESVDSIEEVTILFAVDFWESIA